MRGPIDYILVGFDGNRFDGSILRAVSDAVDQGTIGVIALSVITKDKDGNTKALDVTDLGDDYLVEFTERFAQGNEVVSSEDIDEVADLLAEETAAGLLVIEHLWAKPLKKAIIDANGYLIAEGRIHPEASQELERGGE
jgi:hypothetical protein